MKKTINLTFLTISLFFLSLPSFLNANSKEEPMPLQKEQLFTTLATKLRNRTLVIARNALITRLAYILNSQVDVVNNVLTVSTINLTRFTFSLAVAHYLFADSLVDASFNMLRGIKDNVILSLLMSFYGTRQRIGESICLAALYGPEFINLDLLYKTLSFMLKGNKIHKISQDKWSKE